MACYADAAYRRAGPAIAVPFPRRPRRLSSNQGAANRNHARNRAPGERAVATLKSWNVLAKLRCGKRRASTIIAAIRVLQAIEDPYLAAGRSQPTLGSPAAMRADRVRSVTEAQFLHATRESYDAVVADYVDRVHRGTPVGRWSIVSDDLMGKPPLERALLEVFAARPGWG
ncbi:hypothetical protein GCM10023322_71820 [Rugosimonospora acidiphila]|uniref:DDE Tnp4 domain-containing protein n=1 Tax=Rugosimonospora acidiphila TaxID=556531 RepID=A0ABP9SNJ6_9ACTN